MQNHKITTQEGIVNYYEYGNAENPIIVCLHGLAGNSLYSFEELAFLFEEKFHLIIVDSPGHEKTTSFKNEDDYLFSNLATRLHQVIKKSFVDLFMLWDILGAQMWHYISHVFTRKES